MLITFDKVSKLYGNDHAALNDASFTIEPGEFVFLVGPSGAGKTTIMRLLLRDLHPTAGKIVVDSHDVIRMKPQDIPHLRRKIGVVFQDFKILIDRTVFENIALTLEIQRTNRNDIKKRVEEVLDLVNLGGKSSKFPAQLSAGELQRVAIGRAIVAGPKVLLADEPTGNLDPTTSWEILKILKEINKLGTTILMTTHNIDIVNSMKKRVIALDKGKIIKDEKNGTYHA